MRLLWGWPEKSAVIAPLATNSRLNVGKVENVELLGFGGKLLWAQDEAGLKIALPSDKPCDYAITFRIKEVGLT